MLVRKKKCFSECPTWVKVKKKREQADSPKHEQADCQFDYDPNFKWRQTFFQLDNSIDYYCSGIKAKWF